MKNIFLTVLALVVISGQLKAQFEGKHFISGSAGINFRNNNPETGTATNGYGYGFAVDFGKFKTNTMASGWRLSSSLGGGKTIYSILDANGLPAISEKGGINNFSVGGGRFWQFYKHINQHTGVFAGPNADLTFSNSRQFDVSYDRMFMYENRTNRISISVGFSAGIYYQFSETWWATASLAFSDPISVDYSFMQTDVLLQKESTKGVNSSVLNYSLSPSVIFPAVGFGLRYFYNR